MLERCEDTVRTRRTGVGAVVVVLLAVAGVFFYHRRRKGVRARNELALKNALAEAGGSGAADCKHSEVRVSLTPRGRPRSLVPPPAAVALEHLAAGGSCARNGPSSGSCEAFI